MRRKSKQQRRKGGRPAQQAAAAPSASAAAGSTDLLKSPAGAAEEERQEMSNRPARLAAIHELEVALDCRVIAYMLADRPVFGTQVGQDVVRLFHRHLQSIGTVDRIGLVVYTRGGHTLTPLRLVRLIREYCREFWVLVPYRAHSAGTLIALGADRILMGRMGELAPIDPRVHNPFNPDDESARQAGPAPKPKLAIGVEDVIAYIQLARDKAGLATPESQAQAFMELARRVHPLALGNVHRSHTLIRLLAERLLSMHMDGSDQEQQEQMQSIARTLTEQLYAHDFMISRKDAKDYVGLKVEEASPETESVLWKLYELYEQALRIGEEFQPVQMLAGQSQKALHIQSAAIESADMTHLFVYDGMIRQTRVGSDVDVSVEIGFQGWREDGHQARADAPPPPAA